MNTKNALLAGVSALALIVGTSACDRGDREDDNTVVQNLDNSADENAIDRNEATNDLR